MNKKTKVLLIVIGATLFSMMGCALFISIAFNEEAVAAREAERAEAVRISRMEAVAENRKFDSIGDWSKTMCGEENQVEDSFKKYWDKQRSVWYGDDGFTAGTLDDLPSGWIRKVEQDGVVDSSDFPAKYRFVAKSRGNLEGDRHWRYHERFYNYDCSFYGDSISDVDFTKVSMP